MKIAFYGSSLVSAYWNGAATYYRGVLKALHARGWEVTFYEPDAFDRQAHRDLAEAPPYARSVVYPATEAAARAVLEEARGADVVVKASGVGVFDDLLLAGAVESTSPGALTLFWDVDAAATLEEMTAAGPDHPTRRALPRLDAVFTYGGGDPVVSRYEALGAARCTPVYNALDPDTHHPVPAEARFAGDLNFLANRLPDREARVEAFFLHAAELAPDKRFRIGGEGWGDKPMPPNVAKAGHVGTADHNAFNTSPLAVLNVARDSMAAVGFSPATRVFEAAGAGGCLITDHWEGIPLFLEPDAEVLVARDGRDVADHLAALTPERARAVGEAARRRILRDHTYEKRGAQVDARLRVMLAAKRGTEAAA